MNVPFSLPFVDADVVAEVNDALTGTGWLTTGPKVRALEQEISEYTDVERVICVNSWTSGAMLVLRWYGVGPGDEVIVPAYTYSATALCAMNLGAEVKMVDVDDDFCINVESIRNVISPQTKAILPVDMGGWPCDYEEIMRLVSSDQVRSLFVASNDRQRTLARPLVISDAAHSLGAEYRGTRSGGWTDVSIFSFHSVKNVTAGEGGAVCVNLPNCFDLEKECEALRTLTLNGQTKSAFEKNQPGSWRYDIVDLGLKVNMPDVCAAIALAQIRKYGTDLLPERKAIFRFYNKAFSKYDWAILPPFESDHKSSSCHLYVLRIKDFSEDERDELIRMIASEKVAVNVHYIPMAMLTLFKKMGYSISDYPNTYKLYSNLMTLPVYNGLTPQQLNYVVEAVVRSYKKIAAEKDRSFDVDL